MSLSTGSTLQWFYVELLQDWLRMQIAVEQPPKKEPRPPRLRTHLSTKKKRIAKPPLKTLYYFREIDRCCCFVAERLIFPTLWEHQELRTIFFFIDSRKWNERLSKQLTSTHFSHPILLEPPILHIKSSFSSQLALRISTIIINIIIIIINASCRTIPV